MSEQKTLKQLYTEITVPFGFTEFQWEKILEKFMAKNQEWLTQKRQELEEKQDITKYQLLPETYQLIESRKKFCDELLDEINDSLALRCWGGDDISV
jgi:predicted metal-dependent hydrolase